jgi:enoyl-CoA hydratase/carnithine racemase
MTYSEILYEVDGPAAVITLNRPEKLNAWTPTMDREYRAALHEAERDPQVRGIILTGAGRGFCAGADMGTLNTIAAAGRNEAQKEGAAPGSIEANYQQPYSYPLAVRKPLIAAVNGAAVGLGFIHALYCDMRFASENARFGTAFSALGLVAEHGISWLLPRIAGIANALDLLYSARIIGVEEAKAMGIVTRVYPADRLLPAAKEYIQYLAEHVSPRAMADIKRLVWDAQFQDLATAVHAADAAMAASFGTPDFKEGLLAFAEKRPPRFAGLSL